MDDRLNAILGDPEKMKSIFEIASKIAGKQDWAPAAETPSPEGFKEAFKNMQESGALDGIIKNLSGASENESSKKSESDGEKGGLSAMLPNILRMLGGSDSLKSDRANLLKAIKPYVNQNRAESIDHAVNVAGMAKNARSVIDGFKK